MARRPRTEEPHGQAPAAAGSIEHIADELYGLPPNEFTSRRDEQARAARDRGDRDTASAITALRKPSTAAWVANQLVRTDRAEVDAFLELGASLREAQAKLQGEALRALARQRRQVVNGLIRRARQLADDQGRPISEAVARELEQTLEASLADPEAAAALASGQLTASLAPSGSFGAPTRHLRAVPPAPEAAGRRTAQARPAHDTEPAAAAQAAAALERAEDRAREAERRRGDAATAYAEAASEIDRAEAEVAEIRGRLEELEVRLDAAKDRVVDARRNERVARRQLQGSERDLEAAKRAADTARAGNPR